MTLCDFSFWIDIFAKAATIVGAVGIPVAIYWVNRRSQRQLRTIEFIQSISTDFELVSRLHRLYRYRLHEDARQNSRLANDIPADPYFNDKADLVYDHVIALNYFETVSTYLKNKWIDPQKVYVTPLATTIIGVHEVLLPRFEKLMKGDQSATYPALIKVSQDIKKHYEKTDAPLVPQIPTEVASDHNAARADTNSQ